MRKVFKTRHDGKDCTVEVSVRKDGEKYLSEVVVKFHKQRMDDLTEWVGASSWNKSVKYVVKEALWNMEKALRLIEGKEHVHVDRFFAASRKAMIEWAERRM